VKVQKMTSVPALADRCARAALLCGVTGALPSTTCIFRNEQSTLAVFCAEAAGTLVLVFHATDACTPPIRNLTDRRTCVVADVGASVSAVTRPRTAGDHRRPWQAAACAVGGCACAKVHSGVWSLFIALQRAAEDAVAAFLARQRPPRAPSAPPPWGGSPWGAQSYPGDAARATRSGPQITCTGHGGGGALALLAAAAMPAITDAVTFSAPRIGNHALFGLHAAHRPSLYVRRVTADRAPQIGASPLSSWCGIGRFRHPTASLRVHLGGRDAGGRHAKENAVVVSAEVLALAVSLL
jgi:hypothetical protein